MREKIKNKNKYGTFLVNKNLLNRFNQLTKKQKQVLILASSMVVLAGGFFVIYRTQTKVNPVYTYEASAAEIPGWWYKDYFGYSVCEVDRCQVNADPDNDKLNNGQEFFYKSDPLRKDTNGNGRNDGEDVANNVDPSKKGNVTFDQVASDENILGESLLFDADVKKEFAKSFDMTNVVLPLPSDIELDIIENPRQADIDGYTFALNELIKKHLPYTKDQIKLMADTSSDSEIQNFKANSVQLASSLKKLAVPLPLINLHKYTIAMYELMPDVLFNSEADLENKSTKEKNAWYDKTQMFLVISQKLDFELEQAKKQTQ